ncbi:MAG TPA: hypothetical protein VIN07_13590 [Flavipsychrobacter sp.]
MKLLTLFSFGLITVASFSACNKTYTCTCQSAWTQEWYDEPINTNSRRKANQECLKKISPEVDGPVQCHLRP